jgi:tetratricopeptide (TPR) repeat protein
MLTLPATPKNIDNLPWAEVNQAIDELREQFGQTTLAARMTDEQIELIYGFAYDMHIQGKFDIAIKLLKLIMVYRPFDARILLALGLNLKRTGSYTEAVMVLSAALAVSNGDLTPAIHVAECLTAMGEVEACFEILDPLIKLSGMDSAYTSLHKRAESLRAFINSQSA